jgi:HAD superfamily hydrolase (TIGR01509 family)
MDGTLVDTLSVWGIFWNEISRRYLDGRDFKPDEHTEREMRTHVLVDSMTIFHENTGIGESSEEIVELGKKVFERFYRDGVNLKPGVREFLLYLRERGVKMCIASATAPDQVKVVLERCGIADFMEGIISCTDTGIGKEEPDVFIRAHEFLGTPKEETWVFEDSIVALDSATRADFNTVGIYDQYGFDLDKLEELSTVYLDNTMTYRDLIDIFE